MRVAASHVCSFKQTQIVSVGVEHLCASAKQNIVIDSLTLVVFLCMEPDCNKQNTKIK